MDFLIPSELEGLRNEVREFAKESLEPFSQDVESNDEIPPHIMDRMRKKGFFGMLIPEEYGGRGVGKLAFSLIQEEVSKPHLAFCEIFNPTNGCSRRIVLDGTKAQRDRYLPRLARGEILASFALTEPNAGSDAANISTMAERRGDGFILNGTKHFITNASISDLFIVMALTDERLRARGGITAFLVEKDTPGVTIGSIQRAMGWRGIHEGEVILQDVSLPEDNVIGEVGQGLIAALKTVDEGKLGVSSMSVGMADRLLELSIEYAQKGSRSGRRLSEGQSIQWLLADMAMQIHASRLILYTTAAKIDRGERVRLEAATTKVYTAEMVGRVVDSAFEIFGNEGYMKGSAVERICRDARVFRIVDGTSEIQRIVMGRELLKGSRITY